MPCRSPRIHRRALADHQTDAHQRGRRDSEARVISFEKRYIMSYLGHIVAQQMTVRHINSRRFRLASRDSSKLPQNEMEFRSSPLGVRYASESIFGLTGGLCKRAPNVPRYSNNQIPVHHRFEQVSATDIVSVVISNRKPNLMTVLSADTF